MTKTVAVIAAFIFVFGLSLTQYVNKAYSIAYEPISSWTELDAIREAYLSGNYVLTRDLTPSDADYAGIGDNFEPIGNSTVAFSGYFDGDNHKIIGLKINNPASHIGLFGTVAAEGAILDIGVINIDYTGSGSKVMGGLVGKNYGSITNSLATGTINATALSDSAGGLVGDNNGSITSSGASVPVNGSGNLGGLAGYNVGTITNSYATGSVTGSGEFVGNPWINIGGLVGYNSEPISGSYATGNVTISTPTDTCGGGLIGANDAATASITDSYAKGNISGGKRIGGLVGCQYAASSVSNAYSTGNVLGDDSVGGLIGWAKLATTVDNSFTTGTTSLRVAGSSIMQGGLIGEYVLATPPVVTNSFWYKQQAAGATNCMMEVNTGCTETTNLADFKGNFTNEPLASWDFETTPVWKTFTGNYPILTWQPDIDVTAPTFGNLPGTTTPINITEGQTITTNPFVVKVKAQDDFGVSKVEFYVDENLLCTDTTADGDGVYDCAWDTSKYHSVVKVLAYDTSNNVSSPLIRNAVVDPSLYLIVLPKTGKQ